MEECYGGEGQEYTYAPYLTCSRKVPSSQTSRSWRCKSCLLSTTNDKTWSVPKSPPREFSRDTDHTVR